MCLSDEDQRRRCSAKRMWFRTRESSVSRSLAKISMPSTGTFANHCFSSCCQTIMSIESVTGFVQYKSCLGGSIRISTELTSGVPVSRRCHIRTGGRSETAFCTSSRRRWILCDGRSASGPSSSSASSSCGTRTMSDASGCRRTSTTCRPFSTVRRTKFSWAGNSGNATPTEQKIGRVGNSASDRICSGHDCNATVHGCSAEVVEQIETTL